MHNKYKEIINIEVKTSNPVSNVGSGDKSIIKSIIESDLIYLVIPEQEYNGFNIGYELGFSHTINKPSAILCKEFCCLPYYLQMQECINYQQINELEEKIINNIEYYLKQYDYEKGGLRKSLSNNGIINAMQSMKTTILREQLDWLLDVKTIDIISENANVVFTFSSVEFVINYPKEVWSSITSNTLKRRRKTFIIIPIFNGLPHPHIKAVFEELECEFYKYNDKNEYVFEDYFDYVYIDESYKDDLIIIDESIVGLPIYFDLSIYNPGKNRKGILFEPMHQEAQEKNRIVDQLLHEDIRNHINNNLKSAQEKNFNILLPDKTARSVEALFLRVWKRKKGNYPNYYM